MTERVMVTLHLPMEMGAAGRIMKVVAQQFPDATCRNGGGGFELIADDAPLTPAQRRRIAADRRAASRG
jgi:hypothetical protein